MTYKYEYGSAAFQAPHHICLVLFYLGMKFMKLSRKANLNTIHNPITSKSVRRDNANVFLLGSVVIALYTFLFSLTYGCWIIW